MIKYKIQAGDNYLRQTASISTNFKKIIKMIKKILFIAGCLFLTTTSFSQEGNFYYENAIYSEKVKTVQMYRAGFELSDPVYELGENIQLIFKFDDLTEEIKNYTYTVIHCDAGWNESFMPQTDYIDGFAENPILDYAPS